MADNLDQYSTTKGYLGSVPGWIADEQEAKRVASYALYDAIYWTVPDTFKLISRGAEDKPIYVPSGRTIVETMHRYLAPKLRMVTDNLYGTDADQIAAMQVWTDFARRERFYSKFSSNKRYGIIRGDMAFHFYADPSRQAGARLSLFAVDPASIFPIYNPENIDEIIGYHIAEAFDLDGKVKIRRLTYRKTTGTAGPSPITVEDMIFELDKWGGPGMSPEDSPVQVITAVTTLPSPIDQLPIYIIPNFEEPGTIWGSSEMRGLERLMAAINQSISDEELSLAMDGLGVYVTDAGTPVDEDGNDVEWNLGPGRVVEVPTGKTFERVSGTMSVSPYQEHVKYLHDRLDETVGASAVAKGRVDVSTAESGVALELQMGAILARADEKELSITDRLSNIVYDWAKWMVAYEGSIMNFLVDVTRLVPKYGDKLPRNKARETTELLAMKTADIVSAQYVRQRLRSLGFDDMPDDTEMISQILEEKQATALVEQDAFGQRVDATVNAELTANGGAPPTGSPPTTDGG